MPWPPISICIPMRNGAEWIGEAIDSALAQTRPDFELLVVDNASSDGSAELVRAWADERIRLERFDVPVSAPRNHERCIRLARGGLIKFLHADDVLFPECVARMASLMEAHPGIGLVFSRREILLDDPTDAAAVEWREAYAELHTGFRSLGEVNRGRELLGQYLPSFGSPEYQNWIAEPSAVMVRRSCFDRIGVFNPRMRQSWDLELWLRLMAVYDVGFIDERLVAFRHHTQSLTATNARLRADWLDLVWLYEGLLAELALEEHHELIRRFRRTQMHHAFRRQLGRLRRGDLDLRPLGSYVGYRVRALVGKAPPLHGNRHEVGTELVRARS
jgi:glycosyltransferase involved in cell wall biosynthesis